MPKVNLRQLSLFSPDSQRPFNAPFPSTRYQGSKRQLAEWIWENVAHLPFESVLDVFGGTSVVSHLFKNAGKRVIYNDYLIFNQTIAHALIENTGEIVPSKVLDELLLTSSEISAPTFIQDTFGNIYFTDDENRWLDQISHTIRQSSLSQFQKSIVWFGLFQACIAKRPYNLFHRANLYMRTAKLARSFGNKTTWDTPFETHMRAFIKEANAAVFDNGRHNQALHLDALETPQGLDLVYLDPPYLNAKGVGVNYRDFYHFLEGLMLGEAWHNAIDYGSKHRRLIPQKSPWDSPSTIVKSFQQVIDYHAQSILVISYRDDGFPSVDDLIRVLKQHKKRVQVHTLPKKYVLSNRESHEVLLVAE